MFTELGVNLDAAQAASLKKEPDMSASDHVPGRPDQRGPALVRLVVVSEFSSTATEPVSRFRWPARSLEKGPPFNHPRPPLADNYDDDLPPAA